MRIVFMGTPEFAVPSLMECVNRGYDVVGVFTQPDKPKGRGNKLTAPPVKDKALEYHIPVFQPNSIKKTEIVDKILQLSPDMIVVVAYGQILSRRILDKIGRASCRERV